MLCDASSSAPSAILCWVKGLLHSGIVDVHTPVPNLTKLQTYIDIFFLLLSFQNVLVFCFLLLEGNLQVTGSWSEVRDNLWRCFPGMAAGMHPSILALAWLWMSASGKSRFLLQKWAFWRQYFQSYFLLLSWSHEHQIGRKRMKVWKVNVSWWAVSDRCATYIV